MGSSLFLLSPILHPLPYATACPVGFEFQSPRQPPDTASLAPTTASRSCHSYGTLAKSFMFQRHPAWNEVSPTLFHAPQSHIALQSTHHHCNFPFICGVTWRMAASSFDHSSWKQGPCSCPIGSSVVPFTHCMHSTDLYVMDEHGEDLSKAKMVHCILKGRATWHSKDSMGREVSWLDVAHLFISHAYCRIDAS